MSERKRRSRTASAPESVRLRLLRLLHRLLRVRRTLLPLRLPRLYERLPRLYEGERKRTHFDR